MITVRFPSGFSIQYNDANYSSRETTQTVLWDSSLKKRIFAIVPNECVIEHRTPCRMYNAVDSDGLDAIRKEISSLTRKIGKVTK